MQGTNNKIVQQIDIMPSILELTNYNKKYFTFGKSMINGADWAVCYRSGKYQLITNNGILINLMKNINNLVIGNSIMKNR